MSTAPGSASRQVRSKKKKGSSSRPPSSDLSQQKLHQSFTPISSRAVMDKLEDKKDDLCCEHDVLLHVMDKLQDKKDDHCCEHDVLLHGTKLEKPKIATSHTSKGTKAEKPKIATSHTSKDTKAENPKIATSQGNGPRPFRIIGGDPFVPGGKNGGLFTVCEGDPCSPDNFLKTVAGNCYGPYKRA